MNIKNLDKIKEPYVILLIGVPLSGKSTFIRDNFSDKDVNVISRDEIVLDLYGNDDYNRAFKSVNQKEVTSILRNQMISSGKDSKNVIIDMTNLSSKRRKDTLSHFPNHKKIGIIFPIPDINELKIRNDNRNKLENKFIPNEVISSMISSYQPIRDVEGFDYVVSI